VAFLCIVLLVMRAVGHSPPDMALEIQANSSSASAAYRSGAFVSLSGHIADAMAPARITSSTMHRNAPKKKANYRGDQGDPALRKNCS